MASKPSLTDLTTKQCLALWAFNNFDYSNGAGSDSTATDEHLAMKSQHVQSDSSSPENCSALAVATDPGAGVGIIVGGTYL